MISDNSFFGCGLGRMEQGRPDEISIATTAQEPQPSIAAIPFFLNRQIELTFTIGFHFRSDDFDSIRKSSSGREKPRSRHELSQHWFESRT
jgi:hypothetical protein